MSVLHDIYYSFHEYSITPAILSFHPFFLLKKPALRRDDFTIPFPFRLSSPPELNKGMRCRATIDAASDHAPTVLRTRRKPSRVTFTENAGELLFDFGSLLLSSERAKKNIILISLSTRRASPFVSLLDSELPRLGSDGVSFVRCFFYYRRFPIVNLLPLTL